MHLTEHNSSPREPKDCDGSMPRIQSVFHHAGRYGYRSFFKKPIESFIIPLPSISLTSTIPPVFCHHLANNLLSLCLPLSDRDFSPTIRRPRGPLHSWILCETSSTSLPYFRKEDTDESETIFRRYSYDNEQTGIELPQGGTSPSPWRL